MIHEPEYSRLIDILLSEGIGITPVWLSGGEASSPPLDLSDLARAAIEETLTILREADKRITIRLPPPPLPQTLTISFESIRNPIGHIPGVLRIYFESIALSVKNNNITAVIDNLGWRENLRVRIPLNAHYDLHKLLLYVRNGEKPVLGVDPSVCIEFSGAIYRLPASCTPASRYNPAGWPTRIEPELSIEWPKGPRITGASNYNLAREAWVINNIPGDNPDTLVIGPEKIIWRPSYKTVDATVLDEAAWREGGLTCRIILEKCESKIAICKPIISPTHGWLGPFTLIIGSREQWDFTKASKAVAEYEEWAPHTVLPLGYLRSPPAMILPLSFGGPLGVAIARATGLWRRVSNDWSKLEIYNSYKAYMSRDAIGVIRIETGEILDWNGMEALEDLTRRIYGEEGLPTTVWTIFDTVKGPRPGPPKEAYDMMGFNTSCPPL